MVEWIRRRMDQYKMGFKVCSLCNCRSSSFSKLSQSEFLPDCPSSLTALEKSFVLLPRSYFLVPSSFSPWSTQPIQISHIHHFPPGYGRPKKIHPLLAMLLMLATSAVTGLAPDPAGTNPIRSNQYTPYHKPPPLSPQQRWRRVKA